MPDQEGTMTDPEELEAFANPVLEEPDPDAEEIDPLDLEATDVPEGGIVDDEDALGDPFGEWPNPAPGAVREEVM